MNPLNSASAPSSPIRSTEIPPTVLTARISNAIGKAFPGINPTELIHMLDQLLEGRNNYTLIGSASMHLHAILHPNSSCTLPLPNDVDVVANISSIRKLDRLDDSSLEKVGLTRDKTHSHVLYYKRNGLPGLKIDVIKPSTEGFEKYQIRNHQIDEMRVGLLVDSLSDYKTRLSGGESAKEKIQPWLDFFDQFANIPPDPWPVNQGEQVATRHRQLNKLTSVTKSLKFDG